MNFFIIYLFVYLFWQPSRDPQVENHCFKWPVDSGVIRGDDLQFRCSVGDGPTAPSSGRPRHRTRHHNNIYKMRVLVIYTSEDDAGSRAVFDDVDCFRSQGWDNVIIFDQVIINYSGLQSTAAKCRKPGFVQQLLKFDLCITFKGHKTMLWTLK